MQFVPGSPRTGRLALLGCLLLSLAVASPAAALGLRLGGTGLSVRVGEVTADVGLDARASAGGSGLAADTGLRLGASVPGLTSLDAGADLSAQVSDSGGLLPAVDANLGVAATADVAGIGVSAGLGAGASTSPSPGGAAPSPGGRSPSAPAPGAGPTAPPPPAPRAAPGPVPEPRGGSGPATPDAPRAVGAAPGRVAAAAASIPGSGAADPVAAPVAAAGPTPAAPVASAPAPREEAPRARGLGLLDAIGAVGRSPWLPLGLLIAAAAYLLGQRALDGGPKLACAGRGARPDDEVIEL